MRLVLFLNMGGVSKREDCELFLKNMFNDKYILTIKSDILRSFVAFFITKFRAKKMWQNYLKIGGKSPLNDISARLCEKLNAEFLNQNLKAKIPTKIPAPAQGLYLKKIFYSKL